MNVERLAMQIIRTKDSRDLVDHFDIEGLMINSEI